ncbi:DUF4135 domain-containing protein [Stappia sp.]|uniref:DUF4135 domain-containing protein n=1 Tax=Stappia sp. TaxID=1870903 RepID=UPI003C7A1F9C
MIYRGRAEDLPGFETCRALAEHAVAEAVSRAGAGDPETGARITRDALRGLVGEGANVLAGIALAETAMAQAAGAALPLSGLARTGGFHAFQDAARRDGARGLAVHLAVFLADWTDGLSAVMTRLAADAAALEEMFAVPRAARIVGLVGAGGEYHRGACVRRIDFDDGTRIAYKPRPVERELVWHTLSEWLCGQGAASVLYAPQTLKRGDYGWSRWVDPRAATDSAELEAYFRHAGQLLFWLWLTNSRDAVASNLVARGAAPWLIDCETCFYPGADEPAPPLAQTGLLPTAGAEPERARAGLAVSVAPRHSVRHFSVGADGRLVLARRDIADDGLANLPRLDGRAVSARGRAEEVLRGFHEAAGDALRLREGLLADGGPLRAPAGGGRFVLRATVLYGELMAGYLARGRAPAWLETMLCELPTSVALDPRVETALRAREFDELTRISMPKFFYEDAAAARGGSPRLIDGGLALSPLRCGRAIARARLAGLREGDLAALEGEIRAALTGEEEGCPERRGAALTSG